MVASADRAPLPEALEGGLVVSCQAPPDDPLSGPDIMGRMAASVVAGGARAVRVNGPDDCAAVRAAVAAPLIGLWKDGADGVYITPTPQHAVAIREAGADVVAVDGTGRDRPQGARLAQIVEAVHERGGLVMADIATAEQALFAVEAGADLVATTLSGYTDPAATTDEPDLALVERLAARLPVPVLAEGRITTPDDARRALALGAFAVCVGTAITRPQAITSRFAAALSGLAEPQR